MAGGLALHARGDAGRLRGNECKWEECLEMRAVWRAYPRAGRAAGLRRDAARFPPERDPQLFQAFAGSLGLLGIITSLTVQLKRVPSGYVTVRERRAASLAEIFALFAEEEPSERLHGSLAGWLCRRASLGAASSPALVAAARRTWPTRLPTARCAGRWKPPSSAWRAVLPGRAAARHAPGQPRLLWAEPAAQNDGAARCTSPRILFGPPRRLPGIAALFPHGVETFQAFVPRRAGARNFHPGAALYPTARLPAGLVCHQAAPPRPVPVKLSGRWLFPGMQLSADPSRRIGICSRCCETMIAMVDRGGRAVLSGQRPFSDAARSTGRALAPTRWISSSSSSSAMTRKLCCSPTSFAACSGQIC